MKLLKKLIPREQSDKFGVFTTVILLLLVTVNDLTTLYYESSENGLYSIIMFLIGIFILFNVFGNMYRGITVDTSIYSVETQVKQLDGWGFCSICELYAPPRAYHCLSCDKCILKRHNHCLFLGKCAGHKNYRFYLLFILYVWFGTVISNIINMQQYVNALNDMSLKSVLVAFVPWLAWLIGMVSLKQFLIIFTNATTMILFFLLFFYFMINFKMALNGQTWHERARNIKIYNVDWKTNFIEVFGTNWFFAFLCPLSKLKLTNDGTNFKTSLNSQSLKDI